MKWYLPAAHASHPMADEYVLLDASMYPFGQVLQLWAVGAEMNRLRRSLFAPFLSQTPHSWDDCILLAAISCRAASALEPFVLVVLSLGALLTSRGG